MLVSDQVMALIEWAQKIVKGRASTFVSKPQLRDHWNSARVEACEAVQSLYNWAKG